MSKTPLKPLWRNFVLRAQSSAREHTGIAFVQLLVVVQDGNPLFWPPPKVIPLEPRLTTDINTLKEKLTDEQLHLILEALLSLS